MIYRENIFKYRERSVCIEMNSKQTLIDCVLYYYPFIYYINGKAWCLSVEIQEEIKDNDILEQAKLFKDFCTTIPKIGDSPQELRKQYINIKGLLNNLKSEANDLEYKKRKNHIGVSSNEKYREFLDKQNEDDLRIIIRTREIINIFEIHQDKYGDNEVDKLFDCIGIVTKKHCKIIDMIKFMISTMINQILK